MRGEFGGTLVVAALACVALVAAVHYLHFIAGMGNPDESAPPAIAVLGALLVVAGVWLARGAGVHLRGRQVFYIYIAFLIAAPVAGIGFFQRFIILTTTLFYKATPANGMLAYQEYVPYWMCPTDPEVIAGMYEGGAAGVPWGAWLPSILFWTGFMTAFFVLLLCVMVMLRKQWVEREKLVFPLAVVAARIGEYARPDAVVRSKLFWMGIGLAFAFQIFRGLDHYFLGFFPGLGGGYSPFEGLAERPWRQLGMAPGINLRLSLTVLGLGFLINQEISFSIWISFVFIKAMQLFLDTTGRGMTGFPHSGAQVVGAFLAFGLLSLWLARGHLTRVVLRAAGRIREPIDKDEPLGYRALMIVMAASLAYLFACLLYSGMSPGLIACTIGFFVCIAITYARIRAECGPPIIWCLPFAGITFIGVMFDLTGSLYVDPQNKILLAMLGFLSAGFFPALAASQMEAFKLADLTGIPRRFVPAALITGCVVAILASYAIMLPWFYQSGANTIAPFETDVMWPPIEAIKYISDEAPLNTRLYTWGGVGGGVVLLLSAARYFFLGFPLHPIGYIITLTHGGSWMFFSIFAAWLIKTVALSYGGVRLFRLLIPFFLGLPVGEFSGIGLWYLIGPFLGGQPYMISWG